MHFRLGILSKIFWHFGIVNKTFTNCFCFKNDGISEKGVERVVNHEDKPFAGLDDIEEDSVKTMGVTFKSILT